MPKMKIFNFILLAGLIASLLGIGQVSPAQAATCKAFPETKKAACDRFLAYMDQHGGVAQQGYPISDELVEVSHTDGKPYTVQYFQRAVMEYHPENQAPNDVLLTPLGKYAYQAKYPNGAAGQVPNPSGRYFPQTKHTVGGGFLDYWNTHGGLAQLGLPLSDEFGEVVTVEGPYKGKVVTTQYFERVVLQYLPGNPPGQQIMGALLGPVEYASRYNNRNWFAKNITTLKNGRIRNITADDGAGCPWLLDYTFEADPGVYAYWKSCGTLVLNGTGHVKFYYWPDPEQQTKAIQQVDPNNKGIQFWVHSTGSAKMSVGHLVDQQKDQWEWSGYNNLPSEDKCWIGIKYASNKVMRLEFDLYGGDTTFSFGEPNTYCPAQY
jgi:hypothetical protein